MFHKMYPDMSLKRLHFSTPLDIILFIKLNYNIKYKQVKKNMYTHFPRMCQRNQNMCIININKVPLPLSRHFSYSTHSNTICFDVQDNPNWQPWYHLRLPDNTHSWNLITVVHTFFDVNIPLNHQIRLTLLTPCRMSSAVTHNHFMSLSTR